MTLRIFPLVAGTVMALAACKVATPPPAEAPLTKAQEAVVESAQHRVTAQIAASSIDPAISQEKPETHRRDMLMLADDIAAQGDAQALALAAMLRMSALHGAAAEKGSSQPTSDSIAELWLDEAERQAPEDVTALIMTLHMEQFSSVRRQAIISRWRRLEPRNLAPVVYASLPEQALFSAASSTDYYDTHFDDITRVIIDRLSRSTSPALARLRAGETPSEHDVLFAIMFVASIAIPNFSQFTAPCKAEALSESRRRECRWVGSVLMRNSDMLIVEAIGAAICLRMAGTAAERAEADEARRGVLWLNARANEWSGRNSRAYAKRYVELLLGVPQITEQALYRQLVIEAGFPPVPPEGWRRKPAG